MGIAGRPNDANANFVNSNSIIMVLEKLCHNGLRWRCDTNHYKVRT